MPRDARRDEWIIFFRGVTRGVTRDEFVTRESDPNPDGWRSTGSGRVLALLRVLALF